MDDFKSEAIKDPHEALEKKRNDKAIAFVAKCSSIGAQK